MGFVMSNTREPSAAQASTRAHILERARRLFRERGYAAVSFEDVAVSSGLSPVDCRRHYPNKAAIARALYEGQLDELVAMVGALPAGQMADRYQQVLRQSLAAMEPDRGALAALFGAALAGEADFDFMRGAPGERLAAAYQRMARESDDALRDPKALELGVALYTAHMLIVLFWLYDRSPGRASTLQLLRFVHDLFKQLRPMFFLPMFPQGIARLAEIVMPQLVGRSISAAAQENTGHSQ